MHQVLSRELRLRYPELYGDVEFQHGSGWFPVVDLFGHWATRGPQLPGRMVRAVQVKEKLGELRIYLEPPVANIHRYMCWTCSEWSRHVCEICGELGERRQWPGGWVGARCEEHAGIPWRLGDPLPERIATLLVNVTTLHGGGPKLLARSSLAPSARMD